MKQSIDYERFNPFRRPDWRMERVLQMVDRPENPGRSSQRDDAEVRALRNFILRYRHADDVTRNRMGYENPGLFWAYQIYDRRQDDGKRKAIMLECRLLAGQTNAAIAAELYTVPEVVAWYEALFFNVSDRLKSHDWVLDHVLMPAIEAGREAASEAAEAGNDKHWIRAPLSEPFFDPTLKFFAFYGGPHVLDFALSGFRRGVKALNQDDVGSWYDQHFTHRLKQRSGQAVETFEVSKYNVLELFAVHAQIMAIEKSSESEMVKNDNIHKAINGMLSEMTWAVGESGDDQVKGTPIARFDAGGAELRDDELQALAVGRRVALEGVDTLRLPPPRNRAGQEDQAHANAQ